jgi:hypothetical protein
MAHSSLIAIRQEQALEEVLTTDDVRALIIKAIRAKNLTGTFFVSAGGKSMAPSFIIAGKKMNGIPTFAPVDKIAADPFKYEATFTASENGWTDKEICESTVTDFISKIDTIRTNPDQHVLLFTDGHKTRHSLSLIRKCRAKNIHLFCFPPNCTHVLQPLDVGVFDLFKHFFKVHSFP